MVLVTDGVAESKVHTCIMYQPSPLPDNIWRLMMAHLEYVELSNSVRAVWLAFGAIQWRGHSGR